MLDTNVVVSAYLFGGLPRRALDYQALARCAFVTSQHLLNELFRILNYPKFRRNFAAIGRTPDQILDAYRKIVELVDTAGVVLMDAVRDKDDNHVLACAVAGKAEYIVSGDSDLLVLQEYEGIRIITTADFITLVETEGEPDV